MKALRSTNLFVLFSPSQKDLGKYADQYLNVLKQQTRLVEQVKKQNKKNSNLLAKKKRSLTFFLHCI